MGQHHTATAYAHAARMAGDKRQKNFRGRTGELDAAVMFGEPVTMVTELVTGFRQLQRGVRSLLSGAITVNRCLVNHSELHWHGCRLWIVLG
ncbi:hypothetical protein D3C85_1728970 [compost metagenome]